jgi:hypothetical protein
MAHERRHFVRVTFDAPAILTTHQDVYTVDVHDLSLRGALIMVPSHALLTHDMVGKLSIPLAAAGEEINMQVELAFADGPKVGLLCSAIDLDSVTHLRRLIELQLGDPALLERDLAELTHI